MNKKKINKIFNFFEKFKKINEKDRNILRGQLYNNKTLKPLNTAFNISKVLLKTKETSEIDTYIYVALFCIGIEGFTDDPRDNIAILGLLNCSVSETNRNLNLYINEIKDLFEFGIAKYFENWVERKDKSIENFGFKQIKNPKGKLIEYETNNIVFNR
ncbi:MAG: hypothetical protein COZ16_06830 [Flavobacteriaceae bacterium CG_4_10_14_3_um_filter_31_253]|nr:MAG: hypothetical protein COW43_01935 [Flavobacteriaceae bacterium CG17_big_fil_post_rev_8_21_14_2_50_31_13]PIX13278.1 MAG: hypothetical protein COZ74_07155 [Flavobacteriaceae bacterium CG_4_8_14_3_um_filter_31_8]PIY14898.1 MAG: hypothetical protein COZ16_06830 [Flavobacteriaceae bacterium CG_4_10_14_3_um_filter_31_253]PIZ09658.1 MAG: hypothetical protein COY55_11720 [Flavobacteriaceae bacterium CG_4_10_14_0_8_um_filter_31_99]PJC10769.1 MAG: hypothetical protein CO067_02975 [Flavobacteriacea